MRDHDLMGSEESCCDANPVLWSLYCLISGRPIGQPNYNWTERDVIAAILHRQNRLIERATQAKETV